MSAIARGQAKSWVAGIIHALGLVNFLFDQSFEPAMHASEAWKAFGVSESTGGNKPRDIRKMFDMYQFDPNWTLPSMMEQSRLAWMVQTPQGFLMDARTLPLEIQRMLTEAGVIPERPDLLDGLESTQPKGKTAFPTQVHSADWAAIQKTSPVGRAATNGFAMMRIATSFSHTPAIAAIATTTVTRSAPLTGMKDMTAIGNRVKSAGMTLRLRCMFTSAQTNTILRCWNIHPNSNQHTVSNATVSFG